MRMALLFSYLFVTFLINDPNSLIELARFYKLKCHITVAFVLPKLT